MNTLNGWFVCINVIPPFLTILTDPPRKRVTWSAMIRKEFRSGITNEPEVDQFVSLYTPRPCPRTNPGLKDTRVSKKIMQNRKCYITFSKLTRNATDCSSVLVRKSKIARYLMPNTLSRITISSGLSVIQIYKCYRWYRYSDFLMPWLRRH